MENDNHETIDPLRVTAEDYHEVGTAESLGKLYTALAKAQGEFGQVHKGKTVTIVKDGRKLYTFDYAPLDELHKATRKALAANGLAFLQPFSMDSGGGTIRTILAHGEARIVSTLHFRSATDIKQQGGQTTYLRRYAMNCLLGLDGDDDVDNVDSAPDTRPEKRQKRAGPPKKKAPPRIVDTTAEENPFTPENPPEDMTEEAEPAEPVTELEVSDDQKDTIKTLAAAAGYRGPKGGARLVALCERTWGVTTRTMNAGHADLLIEQLKKEIREAGGEVPGEEGRHG